MEMTNKDAIRILRDLKIYYDEFEPDYSYVGFSECEKAAVDMAIMALLEQESEE